jgi:hypothetical protein
MKFVVSKGTIEECFEMVRIQFESFAVLLHGEREVPLLAVFESFLVELISLHCGRVGGMRCGKRRRMVRGLRS